MTDLRLAPDPDPDAGFARLLDAVFEPGPATRWLLGLNLAAPYEWDADTPCECGHSASAHLGGQPGGECLRRPNGGRFCACPAYRPVTDERREA